MPPPLAGGNGWVQADGSLGASAVWQTAAAWGTKTVTGPAENTNYTFTAKARNGASIEMALGPAGSGQTTYALRTLTYTAGAGGTILGDSPQTVSHGGDGSQVTASPALGYHFVQWSDASTANPRTDTNVTADITVTATFAINTYTVSFQTDGKPGATLDGATSQTVAHGDDCTSVTANASEGYRFVKWTKGGADYSTDNPLTGRNVTEDMTLTAVFAPSEPAAVKNWPLYE